MNQKLAAHGHAAAAAEQFYDSVWRFCYYKTRDRELAYDLTQETFCHFAAHVEQYSEQKKLKAYLFTIARHLCVDFYRKRTPIPTESALFEAMTAPERGFEAIENSDRIQRALELLNEEQREVVLLRFYGDLKLREIAAATGAPLSTVKTRLRSALGILKPYLQEVTL